MKMKGNVGEWSELYAMLRLLADGWLDVADSSIHDVPALSYQVTEISRTEDGRNIVHKIAGANIESWADDVLLASTPRATFGSVAQHILSRITNKTLRLEVDQYSELLERHGIRQLKSKSSARADFFVGTVDPRSSAGQSLGYSVKSELGAAATLFNASGSTNIIYGIDGMIGTEQIARLNSLAGKSRLRQRLTDLKSAGHRLRFVAMASDMFYKNLRMIDTGLPEIVGAMVLEYYSSNTSDMPGLVSALEKLNPLGLDMSDGHDYYGYKVKQMLRDMALGMRANSAVWDGTYEAGAGYIVIRPDGGIVSFHLYNLNDFQDYLYFNTALDTPSQSRHQYGDLYLNHGRPEIKLNLQIRFRAKVN